MPPPRARRTPPALRAALRLALVCALGVATAVLIACGSSGKGLIAASEAGPLKSDIEAVDLAAQEGNGNCTATEAALQRTEQDFAALPASVDSGLHNTLRQGIANLRKVATELCAQPIAKTTTTATTPATTPTTTTKTTSPAEEREKEAKAKAKEEKTKEVEEKATKEEETEVSPGAGGGTPAPGEGAGKSPAEGAGGAGVEETPANGAGGQETK
jgi:hypothetical protein